MSLPVVAKSGSEESKKKCDQFVDKEVKSDLTTRLHHDLDPAMDSEVIELDIQVSMLRCQIEMESELKCRLESEQRELKEGISVRLQQSLIAQGEIVANLLELERLKKKLATQLI